MAKKSKTTTKTTDIAEICKRVESHLGYRFNGFSRLVKVIAGEHQKVTLTWLNSRQFSYYELRTAFDTAILQEFYTIESTIETAAGLLAGSKPAKTATLQKDYNTLVFQRGVYFDFYNMLAVQNYGVDLFIDSAGLAKALTINSYIKGLLEREGWRELLLAESRFNTYLATIDLTLYYKYLVNTLTRNYDTPIQL